MRALAITGTSLLPGCCESWRRQTPAPRSIPADVGGNALKRHHGRSAGVLGDLRPLAVTTPTVDREHVATKPH
jgi:hypothetical protein